MAVLVLAIIFASTLVTLLQLLLLTDVTCFVVLQVFWRGRDTWIVSLLFCVWAFTWDIIHAPSFCLHSFLSTCSVPLNYTFFFLLSGDCLQQIITGSFCPACSAVQLISLVFVAGYYWRTIKNFCLHHFSLLHATLYSVKWLVADFCCNTCKGSLFVLHVVKCGRQLLAFFFSDILVALLL